MGKDSLETSFLPEAAVWLYISFAGDPNSKRVLSTKDACHEGLNNFETAEVIKSNIFS